MTYARDEYVYSRAATRSALFSFQINQLPFGARRRFERAWKLLTQGERALLGAHKTRTITDWAAEVDAVDRLRDLLRQVDTERRVRRQRPLRAAA